MVNQILGSETSRGGAGAEHRAAAGALAGSHRMGGIESLNGLKTVIQEKVFSPGHDPYTSGFAGKKGNRELPAGASRPAYIRRF